MRVERFVKLIVAGGLALLAGLWVLALAEPRSTGWLVGAALAVLGAVSLFAGIGRPIRL
ncbi:MAG: hypothetical protein QXG03_13045 [Halalkalicoccus sp.]